MDRIRAVLLHVYDGKKRIASYYYNVLRNAERNYSVIRRELLGFVEAVSKSRLYLSGKYVKIRTDNASLFGCVTKPHLRQK